MNQVLEQPTPEQKLAAIKGFASGGWTYRFKVPPVCTAFWTDQDWVKYVDACRGWVKRPTN